MPKVNYSSKDWKISLSELLQELTELARIIKEQMKKECDKDA